MERLSNGQIKIIGQKLVEGQPNVRRNIVFEYKSVTEERCGLSRYFGAVHYCTSQPITFAPGAAFIGCMAVSGTPRTRRVETALLNGSYAARGQRYSFILNDPTYLPDGHREPVIVFKFDGSPYYKGYWFKNSRTLIRCNGCCRNHLSGFDYLEGVILWLL